MSVRKLASLTGLATSTIYDLERGDSASTTKLPSIAAALEVRAEWLETGRGAMRSPGANDVAKSGVDPELQALLAMATPRSRDEILRIAQAAAEGLLTETDVELLASIAKRFQQR